MDIFEILNFSPVTSYDDAKYTDITTDGQFLYLLDQTSQRIFRCDDSLQLVAQYHLQRQYHSICYDCVEKCYWGCFNKSNTTIYKLNTKFAEVDCFDFISYQTSYGGLKSLSFNNKKNCLILTYSNRVVEIDKHTRGEISLKFIEDNTTYKKCISSNNIYYCLNARNCNDQLCVSCRNQLLIHSCLPADYQFVSMVEGTENSQPIIYILTVKHGSYYYLLKSVLVGFEDYADKRQCEEKEKFDEPKPLPCQPEEEECCRCEAVLPSEDCQPEEVGCLEVECLIDEDCEVTPSSIPDEATLPPPCECPPCECPNDCEHCFTYHCCESSECCNGNHCQKCNCCNDCDYDCNISAINKSCTDIIESIALVETAIAHILNAEGEKIQKAVANSDKICEIMEVNESVIGMVAKITQLEQVICSKLEITHKIIKQNRCQG